MERFRLGRKAAKDPAPPIEVDAKWAIGTKAAEAMEPQEAIALMKRRAAELNGSAVDAEVPNGGVPAAGEAELEVESAGGSADTVGVATDVASAPGAPGAQSIPLPGEELPADATLRVRTVDPGTSGISGSGSFVVAMDGGPPPPSQTERTLGQITGTRQRRMRTRPWTRRAPNLTPEEWLALFPAPAPPFSVLGTGEDEIEDPAAALREANPLTRKSILRETESSSMMHFIFSVSIFLMPWNSKWLVRSALFFLCYFGVILFLWTSNGGTLGSLQLAGVTIAAAVELLAAFVGLPIVLATFRRLEEAAKTKSDAKASEYDLWPVASYVRWSELVRSSSCSPTDEEPTAYNSTSALLAHDPEDKLCPCPRPSCMGSLGDSFARLRLLQVVTHIVVLGVYEVFRFFTPLFTLGSAAWWGLMLAILAVITAFDEQVMEILGTSKLTNVVLQGLSRKMHRRAMVLSLSSFLSRYRLALTEGAGSGADSGEELYTRLHTQLAATWKVAFPSLNIWVSVALFGAVVQIIVLLIYTATGSCVPLFIIIFFILTLYGLVTDLVNLSVSNGQISDITDLYADARRMIREMIVKAESTPGADPGRDAVQARLRSHEELLASYLEVGRFKARLGGYEIDFGFTRNLLVTLFTVVIGLYTLLRGSGLFVTLESVCPPRL